MKTMLISVFIAFLMHKGSSFVIEFWHEWYKEFPYKKKNRVPIYLYVLATFSADVIAVINIFRFLFSL